ncbi:hydrolase [Streptomyces sp. NHF165]|uniref:MBL fold metallo-hydrolase n=1 Tax=Streptomyces sp. NHF165 TaxID=2175864 RepID=UPI00132F2059|nr:MBL fold metallo-hydrolase [Streptomyces sp. NHF165]QHF93683.1 hydrolase [Streptomyces sp. NHF165]
MTNAPEEPDGHHEPGAGGSAPDAPDALDARDTPEPAKAPAVTDHGGGVWSIPVPIPDNPLGHTLVHLIDTDAGPVLVDTGWDDPDSWQSLVDGLAACGTDVQALHGVLITHHHPDHHGLSARVREESGAWIAMHPADTDVVRRTRSTGPEDWLRHLTGKLAAAGAPESHTAPLHRALTDGSVRTLPGSTAAVPDLDIEPGALLPLPGRRLRAVWTPGHTPGHVCLHLEEQHPEAGRRGLGRLFSGDHLLPGITPHIGLYEIPGSPETADPLGDYLDSLDRIARLRPAQVLPAHQHPFDDAPARAAELRAHHEQRLLELLALLTGRERTLWELTEALSWNRPWARIPFGSRNIAVAEAEAHLRHLLVRGRAEPVHGSAPATYRAA